jgi:phosphohistidine phosphatase
MKTLYIVRHAKSSWKDSALSDFDRPLNKRGKRDVPDMGARLKALNILPDILISSPANRALTAAKGIAEQIGYPFTRIVEEDGLYHASSRSIIQLIANTDNKRDSLMIFGHNPGFTYLINELSDFYLNNLPTTGICGIEFPIDSWKALLNQKGKKVFYDFPKSSINKHH